RLRHLGFCSWYRRGDQSKVPLDPPGNDSVFADGHQPRPNTPACIEGLFPMRLTTLAPTHVATGTPV
ncbi:MAG: hypothetical protein VX936_05090, partial [Planctomycetota bacterium]|nr:hypothetical protein [Planctomycetota bacterium]